MDSYVSSNRLRIANYSSELKIEIDAHVETFIVQNHHDQSRVEKVNKAREEWIKEIDDCESANLAELEKREDRDLELEDETLLKRFCFIFEYLGDVLQTGCFTWRFVSTNTFMSPKQIDCFQVMIDFLHCDSDEFDLTQLDFQRPKDLLIIFKQSKSKIVN